MKWMLRPEYYIVQLNSQQVAINILGQFIVRIDISLILQENAKQFLKVVCHFYSYKWCMRSICSTGSLFGISSLSNISNSSGYVLVSHHGSNLHFIDD